MIQVPREAEQALSELRDFGGEQLLRSLLQSFIAVAESNLQSAELAAANGDRDALSRVAHTLKSSSAQVGLLKMSEASYRTERLLRDDNDFPGAVRGLQEMRRLFEESRAWIEAVISGAVTLAQ